MNIVHAQDATAWDSFLEKQTWSPFLQSWTMGEVYREIGQEPLRLVDEENGEILGQCFAHVVPARRGKHLSVPYGPVLSDAHSGRWPEILRQLLQKLRKEAAARGCSFLRISPFWEPSQESLLKTEHAYRAPMHLLAEHLWLLPLKGKTEADILAGMRKTARNLIRRAEKVGVTIRASEDPQRDIAHFLTLHEETKARHQFTPYRADFFRSQLQRFSEKKQVTLYLAEYQGQVIASSIHMHMGGETSYHHGASASAFAKIPSSYLLQWKAISDAMKRGDHVYNFWGIAPAEQIPDSGHQASEADSSQLAARSSHPFAGITTFKTGFGGERKELCPCMDIPLSARYHFTWTVEMLRKWRRGF